MSPWALDIFQAYSIFYTKQLIKIRNIICLLNYNGTIFCSCLHFGGISDTFFLYAKIRDFI